MAALGYYIRCLALGASALLIGALGSTPALAATATPAWRLNVRSLPTNFAPGASAADGSARYFVVATNIGGAATTAPSAVSDTVPLGLTPVSASGSDQRAHEFPCDITGQLVTCTNPEPVPSGGFMAVGIRVDVDSPAEGSTVIDRATVSGGGTAAEASATTTISSSVAPFDFLPGASGFSASLTEADGSTATQAGSHPYQLTVDLAFPAKPRNGGTGPLIAVDGGLRDIVTDLPRGLMVNPTASPVRCTEAQLQGGGCPNAAAVGTISLGSADLSGPSWGTDPLYNMVPPPGAATSFGFNAAGIGTYIHLLGGIRGEGDYALSTRVSDLLSRPENPLLAVQLQIWGDPSSSSHDRVRGSCLFSGGACPVPSRNAAFLTSPGECSGRPLSGSAFADSWEAPGVFHEARYEYAGRDGRPVAMVGCAQLEFDPRVELRPTTTLADSPSGLEFALRQPQLSELETTSPASLRDARVALPPGLVVNPAAADGLASCPPGIAVGCPDAAKIGAVEVETPLLEESLAGSVYLAKPFENPFGTLLAVYLVIDDPVTGIVARVPGEVHADPRTGQLTASFEESPELPLETVHLHVFSGPRALLVTPPTCGIHTAVTDLTPWSSPEGQGVSRVNSFETTAPADGACPKAAGLAPHSPAFDAGVTSLRSGAYAPFVLKVSREDGSQRLAAIDATMPAGLTASLAGVPYCSGTQAAAASCPAAAEVGTVAVGAGAGIAPLHIGGHAYLAGPYKGAPLSLVAVVPAVAGPFDLGTMVVRVALYVDPRSARIHAVSDPLPTILQGIPLDIRSLAVSLDRPGFTRNPTSCDPMSIVAAATSQAGQGASLSSRFQVASCSRLGFEPRASVRLFGPTHRGAHPTFRTVLTTRPGDANIRRAAVTLPGTELLDNRHIGAVCAAAEFAARQCPPASVYGHAKAWTPLLDRPLEGPVYLRASRHRLPDLAASLDRDQIHLDLSGRVDSVHGRLRNTFQGLPDVPLRRVVLTLRGGRRGLLVNTGGLCSRPHRVGAELDAHNGKAHDVNPVVETGCGEG